jgi:hypothetical protein
MTVLDIDALERRNRKLAEQLETRKWGINKIKDDEKATKFYTGLPSFAVFMWLFK